MNTVCDRMNFCCNLCKQYLEEHLTKIGGFNDNSQPLVVEIDESKFFHRKYHRGQWRKGHRVLGGVEHGTGWMFSDNCSRQVCRDAEGLGGMLDSSRHSHSV